MEFERMTKTGVILVITGRSGAGKDAIFHELLNKESFSSLNFRQVVTHATRAIRDGEQNGVDYHFVSEQELMSMHNNDELVEKPTSTGTSFKATSKKELLRVLEGDNLVWRIDLSRAAEVASGIFFNNLFDMQTAKLLKSSSKVVLIDVDKDELTRRRIEREMEQITTHLNM